MVAAAPRIEAGVRREMRVGEAAVAAAVAAAAAGGVFAVAVLLTDLIGVERIRTVFIKISPQLMEFLTFGRSTVGGAVIIVVVSTAAGVAGGLLRVAPPTIRKPVSTALIVTALFGFLQRVIPIMLDQLVLERDWLYSPIYDGLTWIGALVVAAVSAGVSVLSARFGGRVREEASPGPPRRGEGPAISPLRLILAADSSPSPSSPPRSCSGPWSPRCSAA